MQKSHTDRVPFIAPGEREAQRYASNLVWEALMLAQTPETWAALIHGQQVPADMVDSARLAKQNQRVGRP